MYPFAGYPPYFGAIPPVPAIYYPVPANFAPWDYRIPKPVIDSDASADEDEEETVDTGKKSSKRNKIVS